jgi:hypothetical protein
VHALLIAIFGVPAALIAESERLTAAASDPIGAPRANFFSKFAFLALCDT